MADQNLDIKNIFGVEGQVVLVTGGGRGVGEMIASGFVQNGATVYISSRTESKLKETADKLNKLGKGKCIPIAGDLSEYDGCVKLAEEIGKREQHLNVLVNNSGIAWGDDYDAYPDEGWDKCMNLNVQRVFTLTQKLTPLLRKAAEKDGNANIINTGSVAGEAAPALPTFSYSASKAALHHLARHLARHLAPEKISCNTIALGPFATEMMEGVISEHEEAILSAIPLRRFGDAADVAGTCIWLASKAGHYVTGATIPIDGGFLCGARNIL